MPYNRLSTAKIARAAGCHPNTVRLYEQWGLLPPVERNRKGYRLYTQEHLDQMIFARTAFRPPFSGREIRRSIIALVKQAAAGDLGSALEKSYQHLALVQAERAHAEAAAGLVERWASGIPFDSTAHALHIRDTAALLGLTVDMLRNWERSGLLEVPRDPKNRYRLYGQEEIARLRVIRMLRNAGYSTMAILRMLVQLDEGGEAGDLRAALDTPRPDEDVYYAADHWLTTLKEQEQCSRQMIVLLEERILRKQQS